MVTIDTVEANIAAMHRRLEEGQISLRPHIKVHRIPELGRIQASARAMGIACQTLDEIETMVGAGFGEILLTNSLVDREKLSRFVGLMSQATLAITADSDEAIQELSAVARITGQKVSVYVECDIGGARTGFADPSLAASLLSTSRNRRPSSSPGLPVTWVAIRIAPILTAARRFLQKSCPNSPAPESLSLR